MSEILAEQEAWIRLGFFLAVFGGMAWWESIAPRRDLSISPKHKRWMANISLVVVNTFLLRLLFPAAVVAAAVVAEQRQWGVLHLLAWPLWIEGILAVVALDLVVYLQHVLFHAVPAFWRLHRVHHADLDFDVTTGSRFHPLEILLSTGIKVAAVLALGPAVLAVLVFEIVLNASSMFNHSNVRIPVRWDRGLRWCVVTPDMHRVHHSIRRNETNSNFGFTLPWWDRLLGTYIDQPRDGHTAMLIGISDFRDERRCARLSGMLMLPFTGGAGAYPVNRGIGD